MIQLNGGRGRDGEHKKVILLSATPINNDLYDLANQIRLFTQSQPDYFREAGIGDFNAYFRRARRMVKQEDASAGVVLFNLLEEIMVRNTRPYIRAAYPNATIKGKPVAFPESATAHRRVRPGRDLGGLYDEIVAAIDSLSLAPYKLEAYKKKSAIQDEEQHKFEEGREEGAGRHLQDPIPQAAGIEHRGVPPEPAPGTHLRGNLQGLPAGRQGRLVEGFSEGHSFPGPGRRGRLSCRKHGGRTGCRGRGKGVHREPADRGSQPVRTAEADAMTWKPT